MLPINRLAEYDRVQTNGHARIVTEPPLPTETYRQTSRLRVGLEIAHRISAIVSSATVVWGTLRIVEVLSRP